MQSHLVGLKNVVMVVVAAVVVVAVVVVVVEVIAVVVMVGDIDQEIRREEVTGNILRDLSACIIFT